mgnify:CR=1 FL=1
MIAYNYTPWDIDTIRISDKSGRTAGSGAMGVGGGEGSVTCCYALKGTEFKVQLTPDKAGTVSVVEGSIRLRSRAGHWPETGVGAGEQATLHGAAPPTKALMTKAQITAIKNQVRPTFRPPALRRMPQ